MGASSSGNVLRVRMALATSDMVADRGRSHLNSYDSRFYLVESLVRKKRNPPTGRGAGENAKSEIARIDSLRFSITEPGCGIVAERI